MYRRGSLYLRQSNSAIKKVADSSSSGSNSSNSIVIFIVIIFWWHISVEPRHIFRFTGTLVWAPKYGA